MRIPLGLRAAAGSGGGGPANPWDIGYASFTGTPINWFNVEAQDNNIHGVTFKSDGTKMFTVGINNDNVYEYTLSTAWVIRTASYVQSLDVSGQDVTPVGLTFSANGDVLYVVGATGDSVYQYDLTTAWDLSTASYTQSFSVSTQENTPNGVFFKTDGLKMFVCGNQSDSVNEYTLTTAWDISTASFSQSFSVSAQQTGVQDLFFKNDGTEMYIIGNSGNRIQQYSLSTAWDISTASYTGFFNIGTQIANTLSRGVFLKSDGTVAYMADGEYDNIYSIDLSTAWSISTGSFNYPSTDYFSVATEETVANDIYFKDDGTKMYIIGANGDDVNEYLLSTAWAIHTASYTQSFSVTGQDTNPTGLFFKSDGAEMFICGNQSDSVHQYTLSTPWDISTASFTRSLSVSSQELTPQAVFFKNDGTKMYVLGATGDDVNEYSLSTAWDISTASFSQSFSVSAQETNPTGLFFKSDGTKMYVTGDVGNDINEYSLSTAWDVSTASYVQNNALLPFKITAPEGVFFKPDGGKMFIIDSGDDAVWAFTIS